MRTNIDPSQSVVVFDAGMNDDPASPDTLAADLATAAEIAGPRCMVFATINRPPYNGYSVDGLNGAVTAFVASRPGTQLVDWRSAALANPGLIYSDGVHPNSGGYQLRAQLVARAIQGCLITGPSEAPASRPAAPAPEPAGTPAAPSPASLARGGLRRRASSGPRCSPTWER